MCGISGVFQKEPSSPSRLRSELELMARLLAHRGPDGRGFWEQPGGRAGFAHNRRSIIDIATGAQAMVHPSGLVITYNGEIYNYLELREELGGDSVFRTHSDTEVILEAFAKWGESCLDRLRGMFAFAIFVPDRNALFCARDRFGIKPFYFAEGEGAFRFASEAKALLPFLPEIETDPDALRDYLTFQFTLGDKTLFRGIRMLEPAECLWASADGVSKRRYWETLYRPDFEHTDRHFNRRTRELVEESVALHLRADVPVGAYLSGGLDSSIVATLASRQSPPLLAFTGAFKALPGYDETPYAQEVATKAGFEMMSVELTAQDFLSSISDIVYHLDYPVAGPGSFPQYHVSKLAARHRKVVLGGQGGDEIFGGYARYLIGYFEQCIKAAIDGVGRNGNFVVTYESIIPNLESLQQYKPLLREFFREGMFEDMDHRYFRLVDRSRDWDGEVDFQSLGNYSPFETFQSVFHNQNVGKESYFDLMTHFDFKTLLPALLQVEDRVSMAHGLESRVPFLDHELVAKIATAPADIKFRNGELKRLLRESCGDVLPERVRNRKDKMGFPVPLTEWLRGPLREFAIDVFQVGQRKGRPPFRYDRIIEGVSREAPFSRKVWGLLCLELWQQRFHDRAAEWRGMRAD